MRVERIKFKDMDALKITKDGIEMVVLIEKGPRIGSLCVPGGKNLLWWDDTNKLGRGDWRIMGGSRTWTTRPGADESEESYAEDNGPCVHNIVKPAGSGEATSVRVGGPIHPVFRIQRGFAIQENPHKGCLDVVHFVINHSDMLWSGGLWALTCTLPRNNTYAVPLGSGKPDDPWNNFGIEIPMLWAGHTSKVNDAQIIRHENLLLIKPNAVEAKRMIRAPQGWMGCYSPECSCSFFKVMPYNLYCTDHYPQGCNIAFYIAENNTMVEMETMGPWRTLKPKETMVHRERWVLTGPTPWDNLTKIQSTLAQCSKGLGIA